MTMFKPKLRLKFFKSVSREIGEQQIKFSYLTDDYVENIVKSKL